MAIGLLLDYGDKATLHAPAWHSLSYYCCHKTLNSYLDSGNSWMPLFGICYKSYICVSSLQLQAKYLYNNVE